MPDHEDLTQYVRFVPDDTPLVSGWYYEYDDGFTGPFPSQAEALQALKNRLTNQGTSGGGSSWSQ